MKWLEHGDYVGARDEADTRLSTALSIESNDGLKVSNYNARAYNLENAYNDVNDRIKAATGAVVYNPMLDRDTERPFEEWRNSIFDLKSKHPDALDWDSLLDEPDVIANRTMNETRRATEAYDEALGTVSGKDIPLVGRVPIVGAVAAFGANMARRPLITGTRFAAGLYAQMHSPVDAAANLLGFAAGGPAQSLLKNAVKNGLTNAALQAPLSALKQTDYQAAGLPYGWQAWLSEVENAAATGFALDLAVRGPSRAILNRYGRDVEAGGFASKNTVRGGFLFDAIEQTDVAARARPPVVDKETAQRALDGDLEAQKIVLERTGMTEDPAVRGALRARELNEALTEPQIKRLEELGVARADGMRMLHSALAGETMPSVVEPVAKRAEALMPEGRDIAVRQEAAIDDLKRTVAPEVAAMIDDGLAAGLPRIVQAVKDALAGDANALGRLTLRDAQEAALHGMRGDPVTLAGIIREAPDLIDDSMPLDTPLLQQARSIARLDPATLEDARGTPPAILAHVSDTVPEDQQGRVLADLRRLAPATMAEARDLVSKLAPMERDGPPLARVEGEPPTVEQLRQSPGPAVADAMEARKARDDLASNVETLRGEIAKLEEAERNVSRETTREQRSSQEGDGGLAAKREQLHQAERDLADAELKVNPTPDGEVMYRVTQRALSISREIDVYRAVNDAVMFGRSILPDGVRIDVLPDREMVHRLASGDVVMADAVSDSLTGHIDLALNAIDPKAKLGHEAVHTLRTLGLLSPDEIDTLAQLARETGTFQKEAEYRDAYQGRDRLEEQVTEEAAASYIEARIRGDVKGPENTIVNRIKQLIERIKAALAGGGFKSREDIVQALLSGEMAKREARAEWMRNAQAAMRSEDITAASVKDGKLFAFAGERAKTADLEALSRAKGMEAEGKDRTSIWTDTGWFRGVDGKWRFEIDDSGMKWSRSIGEWLSGGMAPRFGVGYEKAQAASATGKVNTLQMMRHPELYAAYPSIAYNALGVIRGDGPLGMAGVDVDGRSFAAIHENAQPMQAKTGLLHEVAGHSVQHQEGFAKGGNRQIFTKDQIESERARISAEQANRPLLDEWTVDSSIAAADMTDIDLGRSLYRRLAGEAEARLVEKRANLTPEQRRSRAPWLDYDVPEDQQIVRFGDEKMFAIADRDTGRSMRADLDALGYYSKALEAAKGLKQAKGTPEQMLAQLKSAGVKDAEIEATKLNELLVLPPNADRGIKSPAALFGKDVMKEVSDGTKPRMITRDEIVKHLTDNRVVVREAKRVHEEKVFEWEEDEGATGARPLFAKWQRHSLDPSNPSYRETVLHLPEAQPSFEQYLAARQKAGTAYTDPTPNSLATYRADYQRGDWRNERSREYREVFAGADNNFRSGHFPEPNIVGHMMTSLNKHEGKPVYTLDQIQSDWGQKLRDGGVRDEAKIAAIKNELSQLEKWKPDASKQTASLQSYLDVFERQKLLEAELRTAEAATTGHALVNTTDQWTNTTLRRALRQAAEADADYIAIPHGDTVLSYNPGDKAGMQGFYGSRTAEGIVPKNLRKLLEKIDKDSAKPMKVTELETPSGMKGYGSNGGRFDKNNTGFTVFPLSEKVKRSVVEEGQPLFAFAGERAKTADLEALAKAKRMEQRGESRNDIWAKTGWFRGLDNNWLYEISDDASRVSNQAWAAASATADPELAQWRNSVPPLGEVLEHNRLYNAYPELRSNKARIREGNSDGSADASLALVTAPDIQEARSILLHEVQHQIHALDGRFAGRSTVGEIWRNDPAIREWLARYDAHMEKRPPAPTIRSLVAEFFGKKRKEAESRWQVESDAIWQEREQLSDLAHRRAAVEVEARAVQKRLSLAPEERRVRPPWFDYDVPEEQIMRMRDGDVLFSLSDRDPLNPVVEQMAMVDRLATMKDLIEACRG